MLKSFFGKKEHIIINLEYKSRKEFIKEAQHPTDNIWVVGEVVAEKQGWVEGALSSVEKISLFKNKNVD